MVTIYRTTFGNRWKPVVVPQKNSFTIEVAGKSEIKGRKIPSQALQETQSRLSKADKAQNRTRVGNRTYHRHLKPI